MEIIITGASRGIGAETAIKLASTGDHTLMLISRNISKLEDIKKEIYLVNRNCNTLIFPADLSAEKDVSRVCREIIRSCRTIDILINNAGFLVNKPYFEFTTEEIQRMVMVNYLSPAILIRDLIPLLKESLHSHVINIGSMGGYQGSAKFPGLSYYSSSKGALAVLTECLAEEFKESGIRFNCLALGSADTEMLREAFPGYRSPLTAAEMGGFIADFAISGGKYFNGKILPVSLIRP